MAILKKLIKASAVFFTLGVGLLKADQIANEQWGYLNNNESPAIIDPTQAQDLLNVDVSPNGKSIKKRSGYGLYKTIASGQPIHGGIHFYDGTGNDVQVWGSSTSLWGVVNDGTPTQLISSSTLNATWDCADSQGFAYCVNSSRDALIKTDGATKTWYTTPLGTMVAITPERLLIAGVGATPNTIAYSASNNFTNFTVGINASDASTEQIAAPGSKLTHIEYACGRWLWWKDQSFGYVLGTDQTNLKIVTVSNTIGTLDNSSAIDTSGNVYFRAQDGHGYRYDCTSLTKLTTDITPAIQTAGRRTSAIWTQTSLTDWQAGSISPTGQLSTSISNGDVIVSSFGVTQNSSTSWTSGTASNVTVYPSSMTLSTNSNEISNNSFETNGGEGSRSITNFTVGVSTALFLTTAGATITGSPNCGTFSLSPQSGSWLVSDGQINSTASTFFVKVRNALTGFVVNSFSIANPGVCSWTEETLSGVGTAGLLVNLLIYDDARPTDTLVSDNFVGNGSDIKFYYRSWTPFSCPSCKVSAIDNVHNTPRSTITSGSFTSQALDTGFSSSTIQLSAFGYTVNTTTLTFVLQSSTSSTGGWRDLTTSTSTSAVGNRYVRYISTFPAIGSSDNALTTLQTVSIVARSTGTFYSQVKNAPNLVTWDTFNATANDNGGANTFYVRSATQSFTVTSSTPSWIAVSNGGVVTASTGTYFQIRDDFSLTAATQAPTLSDFTVNWFEGTASDKAYAIYFDNAIWWALAYGASQSTNNYVFKFDILNEGWTLYNIPAAGFVIQNSNLYFGSPTTGSIFRYGNATADNGTAINAYWKSKDFAGNDPWLENEYVQFDTIARRNPNQSLTVGYTLNGSTTTTSYTVSLSSSTDTTIRHKKLLPPGKIGGLFNLMFSDTSATSAWEVLGYRVKSNPLPYRPTQ